MAAKVGLPQATRGLVRDDGVCVIPFEVVQARATFSGQMHAHRLMRCDEVWSVAGVRDVTAEVARAAQEMCRSAGDC